MLQYCTKRKKNEQLLHIRDFGVGKKEKLSVTLSLASWWNQPAGETAVLKPLQGIKWVIVHDIVHFSEHPHLNNLTSLLSLSLSEVQAPYTPAHNNKTSALATTVL